MFLRLFGLEKEFKHLTAEKIDVRNMMNHLKTVRDFGTAHYFFKKNISFIKKELDSEDVLEKFTQYTLDKSGNASCRKGLANLLKFTQHKHHSQLKNLVKAFEQEAYQYETNRAIHLPKYE